MPNMLDMVQEDAKKVLEESKKLESRNRSMEIQLNNAKKELLSVQEQVEDLKKRKNGIFKEVMDSRKEVLEEMDKQKSEFERLISLVQAEKKAVAAERIKLEKDKEDSARETVRVAKLETILTDKFSRLQLILRESL